MHTVCSVYTTLGEKENSKDNNQITGCQGLGEGDGIDHEKMQGNFAVIKVFYILSRVVVP